MTMVTRRFWAGSLEMGFDSPKPMVCSLAALTFLATKAAFTDSARFSDKI
jgi:hypothetical protein